MVTITRSNITNAFPIFIRDVLRENLTDLHSPVRSASDWIFKGEPEDREFDPPTVIVELSENDMSKINMEGSKMELPSVGAKITVWARKMEERDNIADEIKDVLTTITSDDGSISISANNLIPKKCTITTRPVMINKFPKIVREGVVTISYDYTGA